jgi:hypothetical protein
MMALLHPWWVLGSPCNSSFSAKLPIAASHHLLVRQTAIRCSAAFPGRQRWVSQPFALDQPLAKRYRAGYKPALHGHLLHSPLPGSAVGWRTTGWHEGGWNGEGPTVLQIGREGTFCKERGIAV